MLNRNAAERGSALLEVLVSVLLLGILSAGISRTEMFSHGMRAHSVRSALARQIAIDVIEQYSLNSPSALGLHSGINDTIERKGILFHRFASITVQEDGAREVRVEVKSLKGPITGKAEITSVLLPWEDQ